MWYGWIYYFLIINDNQTGQQLLESQSRFVQYYVRDAGTLKLNEVD